MIIGKTIEERNMVVAKTFVMFLKTHNTFLPYMRATYGKRNSATFTYFLKDKCESEILCTARWKNFIFSAFVWADTPEGMGYWLKLHELWRRVLRTLHQNNYELSDKVIDTILNQNL